VWQATSQGTRDTVREATLHAGRIACSLGVAPLDRGASAPLAISTTTQAQSGLESPRSGCPLPWTAELLLRLLLAPQLRAQSGLESPRSGCPLPWTAELLLRLLLAPQLKAQGGLESPRSVPLSNLENPLQA
jgi:hypothetical protein